MNLYDQLLKLQVLENASTEWELYRRQLTQYIIQNAPQGGNLAILGAGRCNDIDLRLLQPHFNMITLLDKDEKAMAEAIKKYELGSFKTINAKVVNFIGISSEDYRAYADTLIYEVRKEGLQTDVYNLARVAKSQLKRLEQQLLQVPIHLGNQQVDVVVVIGVHSQLLSILEWIWSVILQTIGQQEESVRRQITHMNNVLIPLFNKALLDYSKDKLIIGCEKQRVSRPGSIQGAIQALEDISYRIEQSEVERIDTLELNWPFNQKQNIEYIVQIQTLKHI